MDSAIFFFAIRQGSRSGLALLHERRVSSATRTRAATPQQRLDAIRALLRFKVDVQARIEPLIPFISDTAAHLEELVRHLRSVGVTRASTSYLVLRPDMLELMREKLPESHYQVIKGFKGQPWRKIGRSS